MSEEPHKLEYSAKNILFALERAEQATLSDGVSHGQLTLAVNNAAGFSRGNWPNIFADKEKYCSGKNQIPKKVFEALVEFLDKNDQFSNHKYSKRVTENPDYLHYAVSDFLKLPVDDPDSQKDLAGYYFTYRPRRTHNSKKSGIIVRGLARFSYNPSGAIVAKEITRYKPSKKTKSNKQNVKGYAFRKGDNLFWLGFDSDTKFVRTFLLRRKLNETKLDSLMGALFSIDGAFLYSTPIFFERVDILNYKELMQHMRGLGYCNEDDVSDKITEYLTSHEINKTTFFNF